MLDRIALENVFGNYYLDNGSGSGGVDNRGPNEYGDLVEEFCIAVASALREAVSIQCDYVHHAPPGQYPKMETGNLRNSIALARGDKKTTVGYFMEGSDRSTSYAYDLDLWGYLGPYDMAMSMKTEFEAINNITLYIEPTGLIQQNPVYIG